MEKAERYFLRMVIPLGLLIVVGFVFLGQLLDPVLSVGYAAFWVQLIAGSLFGIGSLAIGVALIVGLLKEWRTGKLRDNKGKSVLRTAGISLICFAFGALMMVGSNKYARDIPYLSDPSVVNLTNITTDYDDSGDDTTYYVRGVDEEGTRYSFSVSTDMWQHYSNGNHPLVTVTYLPNSKVVLSMEE